MPIQKTLSTKKTFNYSKGDVSLNFELTEDTNQLKDFKSLLQEAVKDIKALLRKWH